MNHLAVISQLKNHYFILRHGKSEANEKEIIVSDPVDGTVYFGLIEEGRNQVLKSIKQALEKGILDSGTIIISSDFTRAKETAQIAKEVLGTADIILSPKLRERHFGIWDKTHSSNYQKVWTEDSKNPDHMLEDVESTTSVLQRTTGLIKELEAEYSSKNILLVSHGDALQILQTGFEKVSSSQHRSLPYLETAEVRKLNIK